MRVKQLIEKLEGLATFLTLAASDSGKEKEKAIKVDAYSPDIGFWVGKEEAYKIAFNKVDKLIQEAKR